MAVERLFEVVLLDPAASGQSYVKAPLEGTNTIRDSSSLSKKRLDPLLHQQAGTGLPVVTQEQDQSYRRMGLGLLYFPA